MKDYTNKKTILLSVSAIIMVLLFILPALNVTLAAQPCETSSTGELVYCPLEPDAFGPELVGNTSLGGFLSQAFNFLLAAAAALSVIMIVWGGVEIMLSESVFSKDEGKKKIKNAIYGLLLALFSWLILYTINPDILNFNIK
jgi:hypothetical protein